VAPVYINEAHWALAVYDKAEQRVWRLDSYGDIMVDSDTECLERLLTGSGRPRSRPLKVQQQQDQLSCGIFILCFAVYILRHPGPTQPHRPPRCGCSLYSIRVPSSSPSVIRSCDASTASTWLCRSSRAPSSSQYAQPFVFLAALCKRRPDAILFAHCGGNAEWSGPVRVNESGAVLPSCVGCGGVYASSRARWKKGVRRVKRRVCRATPECVDLLVTSSAVSVSSCPLGTPSAGPGALVQRSVDRIIDADDEAGGHCEPSV
jgi:hypothetical protein